MSQCDTVPTLEQLQNVATNSNVLNEVTTSQEPVTPTTASDGEQKKTLSQLEREFDQAIESSVIESEQYRDEALVARDEALVARDDSYTYAQQSLDSASDSEADRVLAEQARDTAQTARDTVAADAQSVIDVGLQANAILGTGLGDAQVIDGELIMSYLETQVDTLSIVDGDLVISYS